MSEESLGIPLSNLIIEQVMSLNMENEKKTFLEQILYIELRNLQKSRKTYTEDYENTIDKYFRTNKK